MSTAIDRILEWLGSRKLVIQQSDDGTGGKTTAIRFDPVEPVVISESEADAREAKRLDRELRGGKSQEELEVEQIAAQYEGSGRQNAIEEPAAVVAEEAAKAEEAAPPADSSRQGSHPAGLPAETIVPSVPLTPAVQALMDKVAKPKNENGEPVKKVRASRKKNNGIALVDKENPPEEQAAAAFAGNSFDRQVNNIVAAQPSIDTGGEDRLRTGLAEQGIRVFSQPETGIDPFAEPPAAKPPEPIDEEGLDNSPF